MQNNHNDLSLLIATLIQTYTAINLSTFGFELATEQIAFSTSRVVLRQLGPFLLDIIYKLREDDLAKGDLFLGGVSALHGLDE